MQKSRNAEQSRMWPTIFAVAALAVLISSWLPLRELPKLPTGDEVLHEYMKAKDQPCGSKDICVTE